MTTACLAQSNSYALPAHRSFFSRIPVLAWNILVVSLIAVFGIAYLAQVNKTLSTSYEINEVQKKVDTATTAMRANEIKLSEYSTVDNLTTQASAIGMVPTSGVEYVTVARTGVAMR
jgi:cell division protein FtsL